MSPHGTAAYDGLQNLPPLVERALSLARREGFGNSCRPEQGRLLFALASGAELIGETGTGCGFGLAWLAPDPAALVATRRWAARVPRPPGAPCHSPTVCPRRNVVAS